MKAGRELDALVAEKVMGWKHVSDAEAWALGWNGSSVRDADYGHPIRLYSEFRPSSKKEDACEVFYRMFEFPQPIIDAFADEIGFVATKILGPEDMPVFTETLEPFKTCMAALKALGIPDPEPSSP